MSRLDECITLLYHRITTRISMYLCPEESALLYSSYAQSPLPTVIQQDLACTRENNNQNKMLPQCTIWHACIEACQCIVHTMLRLFPNCSHTQHTYGQYSTVYTLQGDGCTYIVEMPCLCQASCGLFLSLNHAETLECIPIDAVVHALQ